MLGPLPQGLPGFAIPWISTSDIVPVLLGGCAIALVSFADTSVLSRAYAARPGTRVDPNQEMVGLGVANLAAGFFQGFPISSSSSRTPVAEAAGARTQLTSVVGALAIAPLLLVAPNLLQHLPSSRAGRGRHRRGHRPVRNLRPRAHLPHPAMGILAVDRLLCRRRGARGDSGNQAWRSSSPIIEFLWDGWRPHSAVLGRAHGVKGYHDITRYPDARRDPGLVLFRWDAPLFFANAELFSSRVLEAVAASPTPGALAGRGRRAGHERRRHVRGHASPNWTGRCTRRGSMRGASAAPR